jgi:predicted O-linked N-acetylglucosamine transferase (SPINDLY family)
MDGFFADAITVPPAFARRGYVEPILELPSIIPFTTMPYSDPVGPLPCLARGVFTFGSFNRWMKMSPDVLAAWAEILQGVPDSRLMLKADAYDRPEIRAQVLAAMAQRGVDPLRIVFRGWTDHQEHIRSYHEVDLALDPFPHTGGVTALEGLWHGVPPVTLLGERVPERLSASFCSTLNLRAFITTSRSQYVETAIGIAQHFRAELAQIRATLQHRIAASPLCVGYTRTVEQHYRDLWRSWCRRQNA